MGEDRVDFFVSHAGADRAWAEWVAWQLTDAGYKVELDAWDWATGQNFMLAMSDALARCDQVVALFSAAYFDRDRYTTDEWTTAMLHVPGTGQGRLVPVRVEDVPPADMPPVLRPLVFADLFQVDAAQARRVLLAAVAGPRRPDGEPVFPGMGTPGAARKLGVTGPRLPGTLPRVWNLPARNPGFTGRDGMLVTVRERLLARDTAVVQAFEGMGGVGKTQLAARIRLPIRRHL
jgi:TIR domain